MYSYEGNVGLFARIIRFWTVFCVVKCQIKVLVFVACGVLGALGVGKEVQLIALFDLQFMWLRNRRYVFCPLVKHAVVFLQTTMG